MTGKSIADTKWGRKWAKFTQRQKTVNYDGHNRSDSVYREKSVREKKVVQMLYAMLIIANEIRYTRNISSIEYI